MTGFGQTSGSVLGSKCAGYFLLHFGHSQIPFALIVCKRNGLASDKAKYVIAIFFKAFNQVIYRRFRRPSPSAFFSFPGRMEMFSFCL